MFFFVNYIIHFRHDSDKNFHFFMFHYAFVSGFYLISSHPSSVIFATYSFSLINFIVLVIPRKYTLCYHFFNLSLKVEFIWKLCTWFPIIIFIIISVILFSYTRFYGWALIDVQVAWIIFIFAFILILTLSFHTIIIIMKFKQIKEKIFVLIIFFHHALNLWSYNKLFSSKSCILLLSLE